MVERIHRDLQAGLANVIEHYNRCRPLLLSAAALVFKGYVEPDLTRGAEVNEALRCACQEWFVFDYKLPNGLTPLQEYISDNPDRLRRASLKPLVEAEVSQLAGDFWLIAAEAKTKRLVLQPYWQEGEYQVIDEQVSRALDGQSGSVGLRIIQIGGQWKVAGSVLYLTDGLPSSRRREALRSSPEAGQRLFADIAIDSFRAALGTYAADDEWPSSTRRPHNPADVPRALMALRQDFLQLKRELGLSLDWPELIYAIHHEDGQSDPLSQLSELFGIEAFPDEDSYYDAADICLAVWDLIPHESLGGVAPYELFIEIERELLGKSGQLPDEERSPTR